MTGWGLLELQPNALDARLTIRHDASVNARQVLLRVAGLGGEVVRQKGSHVRVRAGACFATVPDHGARDIPAGTLRSIERQLAPCLGDGWLRGR